MTLPFPGVEPHFSAGCMVSSVDSLSLGAGSGTASGFALTLGGFAGRGLGLELLGLGTRMGVGRVLMDMGFMDTVKVFVFTLTGEDLALVAGVWPGSLVADGPWTGVGGATSGALFSVSIG